jgi:hypothetical protein
MAKATGPSRAAKAARSRRITVTGARLDDDPRAIRFTAECPEETTTALYITSLLTTERAIAQAAAGSFGKRLIRIHLSRCASCQAALE